jgi:hypothetical protein
MKAPLLWLAFLAAIGTARADPTALALPNGGKLSFDAPPMVKTREVSDATHYQCRCGSCASSGRETRSAPNLVFSDGGRSAVGIAIRPAASGRCARGAALRSLAL